MALSCVGATALVKSAFAETALYALGRFVTTEYTTCLIRLAGKLWTICSSGHRPALDSHALGTEPTTNQI